MARKKRQDTESDVSPVERAEGGKWAPGASPNPGGQPKWVREVREALKEDAGKARALLRSVIDDVAADMGHRLKAAEVVLSYTLPKPKQEVSVEGKGAGVFAGVDSAAVLAVVQKLTAEG